MAHHFLKAGFIMGTLAATACAGPRNNFNPGQKFSAEQLREDFDVAWNTYQKNHPSLYWYTPKDTVDSRFARVRKSLTDSLTENEFRLRLSYAVASVRCGHSSVLPSKQYARYAKNAREAAFPLQLKVWGNDSMVVLNNLLRDTVKLKRGTIVTAIDSIPAAVFISQMKAYTPGDGYSDGFRELQISSGFAQRFKTLYGLKKNYLVDYLDDSGRLNRVSIPLFVPAKADSGKKKPAPIAARRKTTPGKPPAYGRFETDSAGGYALLQLNNFSHHKVPGLIRSSFKHLSRSGLKYLVLDLRSNGGGKINNSTLLTRYLADGPFRVADSVWAKNLQPAYPRYTKNAWLYRYFRWAIARKKPDGHWHNQSTERHVYHPKKKHHFDGQVYVLTGGGTFSASTLFLSKIYRQPNITVVGEETGGGAHGNSAVYIPLVTLPHSGVQLRVPLFRLINDTSIPANGRGIMPDVTVQPDSWHIANGIDKKLEAVKSLIRQSPK